MMKFRTVARRLHAEEAEMSIASDLTYLRPSPPGKTTLGRLMTIYNISSNEELANRADIPVSIINGIREGIGTIDEYIANRLSKIFGKSADLMLRMQKVADFYEKNGRRPDNMELKRLISK